jgi:hypothetical protein
VAEVNEMSKMLSICTLRRVATASFALSLVAVAGCKGSGGAASAKFIPESATVVGGADLAGLQKSKLWSEHLEGMVKAKGADVLTAMEGCDLGLDKWKSVTFGMTADGGKDKIAVVVVADGLGKKETLACAHGKLEAVDGKAPWTAEEDGKVLKMEGGGVGYVVDDNTVVVAGDDWADAVGKLTKGEGKSVMDGSLEDVLSRTDLDKHVWFAGQLPSDKTADMAGMLGAAPKDVSGYFDFSDGMEVKASLGMGSSDEADSVKTKVEGLYNGVAKDLGKKQGLSADTLDAVEFDTDGNSFTIKAKASEDDVSKGMAQAKSLI